MTTTTLGTLFYSFFIDHLAAQNGLRPATIRSYRDTLRLFLAFVAADARRPITQLAVDDLTFERAEPGRYGATTAERRREVARRRRPRSHRHR